jgi:hypothetical protein
VFRIASMTKSFTAAAVVALRDDGALRLDDPAVAYVPELAGLPPASADSPAVTIRDLLTMTAGFPGDDPWGDRQQGLPLAEFTALLGSGGLRSPRCCTRCISSCSHNIPGDHTAAGPGSRGRRPCRGARIIQGTRWCTEQYRCARACFRNFAGSCHMARST